MSTYRRTMYQIVILITLYIIQVNSMSDITQNLLTPMKTEGEACGYESCPMTKDNVLNVHIVPSTLGELGLTNTFDQHFTGKDDFYDVSVINMKRILDFVITELWQNPNRKFTFTDIPYLFKWWKIRHPTVHRMFYQLLRQGRIHLVGGGWSMTDESCNNYHTIIDHFTYSLRKINNTFLDCARPYVTWQADSFGHTSEFASLVAQMGFDGHFISPISIEDELNRMQNKNLEFLWRGSPDLGSSSDIFTHKLFDGYWVPPGFCFGGQCDDPLIITNDSIFGNLEERVKVFLESMKYRQAPHYATNHIMIIMGQRFGYYDAKLWFDNIDKLMRGIVNLQDSFGYKILPIYSTPICYLKAIYESNITLNMEKGDFVPVAYDRKTYFSGLFSSRPSVKYAIRLGHLYLQITKQLQVLGRLKEYYSFFEDFHWIVGAMADRNILSGAMRPYVRDYYIDKLYQSLRSAEHVIKDGISVLLKSPGNIYYSRCLFNISYCEHTDKDNYHVVIYNPLGWPVRVPVRLPCMTFSQYVVYGPDSKEIKSAVMRIPTSIQRLNRKNKFNYELIFFAKNVPPMGLHTYYINKIKRNKRSVKLFKQYSHDDSKAKNDIHFNNKVIKNIAINSEVKKDMTIENLLIRVSKLISKNEENSNKILKNYSISHGMKDKKIFTERGKENENILEKGKSNSEMKNDSDSQYYNIDNKQQGKSKKNILRTDTASSYNENNISDMVETDKFIKNKLHVLKEIIIKLIKDLVVHKIDNATAFILKKGKNNWSKRDTGNIQIDLEQFGTMLRSLLKKHKNVKESDKIPKLAKTLKKYLNYNLRINILGKEIDRTQKKINDNSIMKDEFYNSEKINSQKKKQPKGGKVDTESKENKHIVKRSVPVHIEQILIDILNIDTDIIIDQFIIPFQDVKRNFITRIKRKANTNIFENNGEIKFYSNNNDIMERIKTQAAAKYEPLHFNKSRKKRMTNKKCNRKNVNRNNCKSQATYDARSETGRRDAYAKMITTNDENYTFMQRRMNLNRNKTYAIPDTLPNKLYDRRDSYKIKATTEYPENDTEEDIISGKFEFSFRTHNSTSNFTFPVTNHTKENIKFNLKMTEPTRDFSKTSRPERSLIKKIKNAKKKYLRRQTNNLKIDDEGLFRNSYVEDDEDEDMEFDGGEKNMKDYDEIKMKIDHVAQVAPIRTTTEATRIGPPSTTTTTTTTTTTKPTTTTTKPTITTTRKPSTTTKAQDRTRSNDFYIRNEYINITLTQSYRISHVRLTNGVTMSFNINFYYYASDDPVKLGRPDDKKPGAYVFSTMDNTPMLINEKVKVEVYKSELVEELHVTGNLISYVVRLYKETPYFELTWICTEIPVGDGIGKDIFVRYQTDLNTEGTFYTDSNGRQTMKRLFGYREYFTPTDPSAIPGNYYPVTSKITIEDTQKLIRFSVFNDRTQGGTSKSGNIDLMLNRRLLTDDAGVQTFLNETEPILGKHYFYLTKLSSKPNRIFEKKLEKELGLSPQIFVPNKVLPKFKWDRLNKHFKGLNKRLPVGLNILTLQAWNDGNLLLRIENYLEKSDVIKKGVKKLVLKNLFSRFDIIGVRETTLSANVWLKDFLPLIWKVKNGEIRNDVIPKEVDENHEIVFKPQKIRTFVIRVQYK